METNSIEELLKKYNQQHLLQFYNELNKEEQEELINQIKNIEFKQIQELYNKTKEVIKFEEMKIENMEYIDKYNLEKEQEKVYLSKGKEIIKNNKLAVITMAGGQGTRLGHDGPKGTYNIGLSSNKSIFEILCDKFKMVKEEYGVSIPWYIMTSRENNAQTISFFEENNYFNYEKNNIKFFMQGELPMIDTNGKILLEEKHHIKEAADGHGGIFKTLKKSNIIKELKSKGIEWIFIGGVDNILAQIADPILIGAAVVENKLLAIKTVVKAYDDEKVGVFCRKNGKVGAMEYSEISKELASKRDEQGNYLYGDANILCNLFNIKALEKMSENVDVPYHIAFKKASYIDEHGERVTPTEPNAYKFESFSFDAFGILDDVIIVRGKREEEFAPIKNKDGADSPETAKKLYEDYLKRTKK